MAVTLKEISGWLDNRELNHQVLGDKNTIILGFQGKDELQCGVKIELEEDGSLLQVYSNLLMNKDQDILKVKNHEHSALVLQHMLKINYDEKFGTWEFDPKDGEVRFAVEVPLEDATMTEKQFNRIMGHVLDSDSGFSDILKIMETGECPEDDVEDMFASFMTEMLKAKLMEDLEGYGGDAGKLLESLKSKSDKKKVDDVEDGI